MVLPVMFEASIIKACGSALGSLLSLLFDKTDNSSIFHYVKRFIVGLIGGFLLADPFIKITGLDLPIFTSAFICGMFVWLVIYTFFNIDFTNVFNKKG